MFFVVFGILQAGNEQRALRRSSSRSEPRSWPAFFLYIRARERAGKEPLLSTGLFRNRTSNLALVTQNIQWLLLMGISFVVSVFLQEVRGYNAIETGVVFTAATVGILVSSLAAERLAKRCAQRTLIIAGFVVTARRDRPAARLRRSLVAGRRLRARAAPDRPRRRRDADAVGQRRAVQLPRGAAGRDLRPVARVSNLGSSFGTAIAGTILVSVVALGTRSYVVALIVLVVFGLIGLVAALRLPAKIERA